MLCGNSGDGDDKWRDYEENNIEGALEVHLITICWSIKAGMKSVVIFRCPAGTNGHQG